MASSYLTLVKTLLGFRGGDVLDVAYAAGLSFSLLERAKLSLGVQYQAGDISKWASWRLWWWKLPDANDEEEIED